MTTLFFTRFKAERYNKMTIIIKINAADNNKTSRSLNPNIIGDIVSVQITDISVHSLIGKAEV